MRIMRTGLLHVNVLAGFASQYGGGSMPVIRGSEHNRLQSYILQRCTESRGGFGPVTLSLFHHSDSLLHGLAIYIANIRDLAVLLFCIVFRQGKPTGMNPHDADLDPVVGSQYGSLTPGAKTRQDAPEGYARRACHTRFEQFSS